MCGFLIFFFKQKTAYEMRISDWSSDVCSSDLAAAPEILCHFVSHTWLCRLAGQARRRGHAGLAARQGRQAAGTRRPGGRAKVGRAPSGGGRRKNVRNNTAHRSTPGGAILERHEKRPTPGPGCALSFGQRRPHRKGELGRRSFVKGLDTILS